MTKTNTNKTRETFNRRVRQARMDYYRHAETFETFEELANAAAEYGYTVEELEEAYAKYDTEMRNFYADGDTVAALMECNH